MATGSITQEKPSGFIIVLQFFRGDPESSDTPPSAILLSGHPGGTPEIRVGEPVHQVYDAGVARGITRQIAHILAI